MRILFVSTQYPPETGGGGIGSYVADIAPALVSRGHDVHVLSCAPGQESTDYLERGVRVHRRGRIFIRGFRRVLGYYASEHLSHAISAFLESRCLNIPFDVIEVADWCAEGLLLALLGRPPIVAHLHAGLRLVREQAGDVMDRSDHLADYLERIAVHRSHVVTSPSHLHVDVLQRIGWLRHGNVRVIRYPIPTCMWSPPCRVEDTNPMVLQVGRVEPLKAPEVLIQSLALLKDVPNVTGMFVGRLSGIYGEEMRRLAAKLGVRCEFVGYVPREALPNIYARARVVVSPSRFDNFPLAILEAMAAGKPVVISDRVGVKEILDGTGAGAVVPYGDEGALADALRPLLEDPAYALSAGRVARTVVERELAPHKIAQQREAMYTATVKNRNTALHRHRRFLPGLGVRPTTSSGVFPASEK